MANFQKILDSLKPYVIGIRYEKGLQIVDVVFKEGWIVPESTIVSKIKGDEGMNYYMLYSEKEGVGIDELFEYVSITIQANVEREKKHDLLKQTVAVLKDIFAKNSLTRLKKLKFTFGEDEEDLVPEITDMVLEVLPTRPIEIPKSEPLIEAPVVVEQPEESTEGLSEDDLEILEEEKRGKRNLQILQQSKTNGVTPKLVPNIVAKVELPPKKAGKLQKALADMDSDEQPDCDCGPDEFCTKCMDGKSL
jgi:hypothetical protein